MIHLDFLQVNIIFFDLRCNFAVKQTDMTVNDEIAKLITDFHSAGKPIGYVHILMWHFFLISGRGTWFGKLLHWYIGKVFITTTVPDGDNVMSKLLTYLSKVFVLSYPSDQFD